MNVRTLLDLFLQQRPTIVAGIGGEGGSEIVKDTNLRTGDFKAMVITTDCVFAAATEGNMKGLPGETVTAPDTLHGLWTKVQLVSGTMRLHNV